MIFKNFANQDGIGFNFIGSGLGSDRKISQSAHFCRILAIFSDQDWIWIFIFEKGWIRTGSGYLFDFYNEISLRVIQDVRNYGGSVFFAMVFIFTNKIKMFCQYVLCSLQPMIIRVILS